VLLVDSTCKPAICLCLQALIFADLAVRSVQEFSRKKCF